MMKPIAVDIEHFRHRLLQQALCEALAMYWRRRAAMLLGVMSRPGDYLGASTPAERAVRDARLRADAERCLRHAELLDQSGGAAPYVEDVENALREAS